MADDKQRARRLRLFNFDQLLAQVANRLLSLVRLVEAVEDGPDYIPDPRRLGAPALPVFRRSS